MMAQNQSDAQNTGLENLEAPVRELTEEEAAQVEGGKIEIGALKAGYSQPQPQPLAIKLSDVLISS